MRDRLTILFADKQERLVSDIMDWQLTEFDINKDMRVCNWRILTRGIDKEN